MARHTSYKWFRYGGMNCSAVHQAGPKGKDYTAEEPELEKTYRQHRDLSKDLVVGE